MVQTTAKCEIRAVTTPQDQALFLEVPDRVYANDPHWVPPLRSSVAKQFEPSNPFFSYGRLQQFVAIAPYQGKPQAVGRVVAAVNDRLIEREGLPLGLFGFFECIDDFEIAQELLNAAGQWLRDQGMTRIRGPIDLSTHNNCLFLVEGFDSPPMVMMPYNPAYYPAFMERDGWEKAKDAYAYLLSLEGTLSPEFEKGYRIACKSGVKFRPLSLKGDAFDADCRALYQLFTKAFSNNWSSTPRTEEEFLEEARSLQSLVDPDVFHIAELEGEMIGFVMGLPDYNIPLKRVNGKLDWIGILKFLWFRRKINQGRVLTICALPEHRRKLVPLGLMHLTMKGAQKPGKAYKQAEMSWIYEDNFPSRRLVEASGGQRYKTYRIYEKAL